jgi:hypothetical protein
MNLFVWMPLMFGLGIVALALCFAFFWACERI